MALGLFLKEYIIWHYGRALWELAEIFSNFIWFFYHFFSIGLLSRTLFSPIRRVHENFGSGFNVGAFFETLIVNLISRIAGFFVRIIIIFAGILVEVILLILLIPALAFWLLLPLAIPVLFMAGLNSLFF